MPSIGSSCFETFKQKLSLYVVHYEWTLQKAADNLGWGCYWVGREEELRIPVIEKILLMQKGLTAAHVGKFRMGVCTRLYNWGFSCSC